jgi:N-acetylglucosamine transport system permease protein
MKELKVKNRKNRVEEKSLTITRNVVRIFLIIWSLLIIFPILWAVLSSLKTNLEFGTNAWKLPEKLQWVNYKEAWEGANFSKYFLNSLILSVGTVALSIIMTATSAYVVGKFVHPVVKSIEIFYSIFMMVPQMLLLIPLLQMCKKLNMTKSNVVLFTLMITNALQGVPFYVFLLTPFMRSINNSILEAAEIDGANQFQSFITLVLPMIVPAIFMVGLLSFVGIWNEYVMSITFIKDPTKYTLSAGINELMNDAKAGQTLKFAALIIAMLPILIIYAIFQKPLQNGLSSSDGVKG